MILCVGCAKAIYQVFQAIEGDQCILFFHINLLEAFVWWKIIRFG